MAPALLHRKGKILFLDAYDSFSNNIIAQIEQNADVEVTQIRIDDPALIQLTYTIPNCESKIHVPARTDSRTPTTFVDFLKNFDAVIAGPGPGWADQEKDVGLMKQLWTLRDTELLPVLGICLGFQSMALAFGANIERLNEPRHGLVSEILHRGQSIFSGVDKLLATQYHSLQVDIGHPIQKRRAVSYPGELWKSTEQCAQLEPLAWDFDTRRNGAVLMAAKHVYKPFWGVQFHPESICTNSEGDRIIQNWWASAQAWNRGRLFSKVSRFGYFTSSSPAHVSIGGFKSILGVRKSLREEFEPSREALSPSIKDNGADGGGIVEDGEADRWYGSRRLCPPAHFAHLIAHGDGVSIADLPPETVHCATAGSGRLTVSDVCDVFDIPRNEAVVLESGLQPNLLPLKVGTGRYSIIGLIIPRETVRVHYTRQGFLQLRDGADRKVQEIKIADPWTYIKAVMQRLKPRNAPSGPTTAPFWGGLMGYASYEAGLEAIEVEYSGKTTHPDICFAYITRSIVFDHHLKKIYVQSIRGKDDRAWVDDAREKIYQAAYLKSQESSPNPTPLPRADPFDTDAIMNSYLSSCRQFVADRDEYCKAVAKSQEIIANGHSYELCLTSQNKVRARKPRACRRSALDNNELSWKLYKRLTKRNPAPFSAYMRLHNVHILSSSPERYISWDRTQTAQCRPIKGTVQKTPEVTRADAHSILSSSKERAENLMIVDLVRHQLHGVYGSGNVNVSQLMEVEEYETLWQLVSVVDAIPAHMQKANTSDEWEDPVDYTSAEPSATKDSEMLGFDAFVKSLPAGSMTGAPKKRSCELLQTLENHEPRGIYSGVLGYFDVGGGGDFSVVIRTAVKIDSEGLDSKEDVWNIGAGGAITSQSTPEAEYEEMRGKFMSTARAFRPDPKIDVKEIDSKDALSELAALVEDSEALRRLEQLLTTLHIPENIE